MGQKHSGGAPRSNLNAWPIRAIMLSAAVAHQRAPSGAITDRRLQALSDVVPPELGEFPQEPDWFLVRKTYVTALSTCCGWRKLEEGEVVHFAFPKNDARKKFGRHWELRGVVGLGDDGNLEPDTAKLPKRTVEVLTSCHALVFVENKLVGDPLEKATLKGIDWIYTSDEKAMPKRHEDFLLPMWNFFKDSYS